MESTQTNQHKTNAVATKSKYPKSPYRNAFCTMKRWTAPIMLKRCMCTANTPKKPKLKMGLDVGIYDVECQVNKRNRVNETHSVRVCSRKMSIKSITATRAHKKIAWQSPDKKKTREPGMEHKETHIKSMVSFLCRCGFFFSLFLAIAIGPMNI